MGKDADRHFIEPMHWDEVARRIGDGAVAILPIGAAAKQHGFHLPLNTDRLQAEWLAGRMAEKIDALVREVAGQILGSGCKKLLVLNTGISTLAPVDRALARLASERVKHLWIHEGPRYPRVARQLAEQSHGSHADELETSLMLALAPHLVDMTRAEASPELKQETPGALTPSDPKSPNYSRSGSYGDPTRATAAKGEALLAAMLDDLHEQAAAFIAQGTEEHRSAAVQSVLR
jgi:creatinine amidohydrolase/Fe(II)-dependent formamide hydrolase-like protein